jgi:uncharacterized protein (TIGR03067 family)
MRWHVLVMLAAGCSGAGPSAPDTAVKEDMQKLQGRWNVTSIEVNGARVPADKIGDPGAVIEGDRYAIHDFRLTITIDPTKTPKAIDMVGKEGNGKPLSMIGIFELDGDTLRICFAKPGQKQRPTTFETKANPGASLVVYQRQKENP